MIDLKECFYRVSIKALIKDADNKILMIQEDSGLWELPGGGFEYGEEIGNCLKREISEELGVNLTSISDRPEYVWSQKREKGGIEYHCLFLAYEVKVESDNFQKTPECIAYKFFDKSEIQTLAIHPNLEKLRSMYK